MHWNLEALVKYSTLAKWRALYLTSLDMALDGKLILLSTTLENHANEPLHFIK